MTTGSVPNNIRHIIVDGLPGSGKSLLSRLLSTFQSVSWFDYSIELEQLLETSLITSIPQEHLDEHISKHLSYRHFNVNQGRYHNQKIGDLSSALYPYKQSIYTELINTRGELPTSRLLLNLLTHNKLPLFTPSLLTDNTTLILCLLRNPLDCLGQICSFETSAFDNYKDWTIGFYNSKSQSRQPFYSFDCTLDWPRLTFLEQAIYLVYWYYRDLPASLRYSTNTILIPFSSLVVSTDTLTNLLSSLLSLSPSPDLQTFLQNENLPRSVETPQVSSLSDVYQRNHQTDIFPTSLDDHSRFLILKQKVSSEAFQLFHEAYSIHQKLLIDYGHS